MTQRNSKHKYQYQIDRISRLRKIPRDIIFEISLPKQISMDSTSMRTRLFVFYSLFSFICQVVGLNHNHFLLFSRIFLNLRKLRPKTMHKLRLISNKSQIHDATNLQIIRLLTFSLALNFREILGNICPGNICPGCVCPGSILLGNISPCSPLVLTRIEAFS